ncbi:mechanosensitive ion channel [Anaerolineales bacterium HSG6]|nr:mechanosensitive ion channel [Anaerolineales bacterium HSG6]
MDLSKINLLEAFLPKIVDFAVYAVMTVILLIILRFLSRMISTILKKGLSKRLRPGMVETIARIVNYVVICTGFAIVLESLGVSISALIAVAGGFGIMVGYALAPYQSNIIAGLILLWDEHFKVDDIIDVDGFFGQIESISLRETRIITPDGRAITLPNATVLDGAVENYSEHTRVLIASFTLTPDIQGLKALLEAMSADIVNKVPEATEAWPRLLGSNEVQHDIQILTKIGLQAKRAEPDILSDIMFTIDDYCQANSVAASKPQKLNVLQ